MAVNQFMITDYTELLQLVDLAASSLPVWSGDSGEKWLHQTGKEAMPGIVWKVKIDDSLALCKPCKKTLAHSNITSNVNWVIIVKLLTLINIIYSFKYSILGFFG